jgi:hypothetical protein
MIAWAWAVRLIMDALEKTPAARINTALVGVSGCSRNGKGALVAGTLLFTVTMILLIFSSRGVRTSPCINDSAGVRFWRYR